MKRTAAKLLFLFGLLVVLAPPLAAFEAVDGSIELQATHPVSSSSLTLEPLDTTLIFDPAQLVAIAPIPRRWFAPIPIPTPPNFVLEGTVYNSRTGRPVLNAVVVRVFPTAHAPLSIDSTSGRLSEDFFFGGPSLFLPQLTTDQNGLYSTAGNLTFSTGIMVHCAYRNPRTGRDKVASATASLPSVYVPYVRRDLYLDLPKGVDACERALTSGFVLGTDPR